MRDHYKMIKEAAIKRISDERIWTGRRHSDVIRKIVAEGHAKIVTHDEFIHGFVDDGGRFLNRQEAYIIAVICGQIKGKPCAPPTLMSEDLY